MRFVKADTEWGVWTSRLPDDWPWPMCNVGTEKGIISVPMESVTFIDEQEFAKLCPAWCALLQ